MAFSSAAMPAGELNALGRAKPILGGKNAFDDYNQVPQWSASGSWADSGVGGPENRTNTAVPPNFLHDGFTHLTTYPSSISGNVTVYILFDLKESINIDSMLVLNHNFGTIATALSATLSIFLEVADNSTFTTNLTTVASATGITTNNRKWLLAGASLRFSSVRYARLRITSTVAFTGAQYPRIGEIWVGQRYHLSRNPEIPWDPDHKVSKTKTSVSTAGISVTLLDFAGRYELAPSWMPTAGDIHTGLNDRQTLLDWYQSIEYSSIPFPFILDHGLGTQKPLFMFLESSNLDMKYQGPRHSTVSLSLIEQYGFLSEE